VYQQMDVLKQEVASLRAENGDLKTYKDKSVQEMQEQKDQLKVVSDTAKRDLELLTSRDMVIEGLKKEVQTLTDDRNSIKEQQKENDAYQKDLIRHLQAELEAQRHANRFKTEAAEVARLQATTSDAPLSEFIKESKKTWDAIDQEAKRIKDAANDWVKPKEVDK
jgi:hypothetical protein